MATISALMIDMDETCGGTGYLNCFCGGDFCACGEEEFECGGCEDCEEFYDDWEE